METSMPPPDGSAPSDAQQGKPDREEPAVLIAEAVATIDASPESVFETVADGGVHGEAIPDVAKVEFLSGARTGLGAKFRETRRLAGLKALLARLSGMESTLTECTDFVENRKVRYTSDGGGALWHSVYSLEPLDGGRRVRLKVRLETQPHSLIGRLGPPLMRADLKKGLVSDLKAIKAYNEEAARGTPEAPAE
jgi:hypothetical protein